MSPRSSFLNSTITENLSDLRFTADGRPWQELPNRAPSPLTQWLVRDRAVGSEAGISEQRDADIVAATSPLLADLPQPAINAMFSETFLDVSEIATAKDICAMLGLTTQRSQEAFETISRVLLPLPAKQRVRILAKLRRSYAQDRLATAKVNLRQAEDNLTVKQRNLTALQELKAANTDPKLTRIEGTLFHKLASDYRAGEIIIPWAHDEVLWLAEFRNVLDDPSGHMGVFVVEHDWARAFEKSDLVDAEFRLPMLACNFEIGINGRRIILSILANDDGTPHNLLAFIQTSVGWVIAYAAEWHDGGWTSSEVFRKHVDKTPAFLQVATDQIRAICIMLGSKVATKEIVRAPAKLNAKRAAAGKLPVWDYHVVRLAPRPRVLPPEDGMRADDEKRRSPRLHWRRGHHRQYPNYRIWMEWQLVGNPDLGFIDKHYRV